MRFDLKNQFVYLQVGNNVNYVVFHLLVDYRINPFPNHFAPDR